MNWEGEDKVSHVKHFTLFDCAIETDTIQKLLRFCHAPESFKCLRVCEDHMSITPYNYSYEGFHHDLLLHLESLHSLHLHTKSCGEKNRWQYEAVESFAALVNLRFLEVDEDALFGTHLTHGRPLDLILPPNVQNVIIIGEPYDFQTDTFEEIRDALLVARMCTTFEIQDGCITDAESMLSSWPSIKLQEITDRYEINSKVICSFLIAKREGETSET